MRFRARCAVGILAGLFFQGLASTSAEDEPKKPTPSVGSDGDDLRSKFGVSQLVELETTRKGQSRYGFFINVPKKQKAYISLQEVPARRGYARGGFNIAKDAGGEAKVELTFDYSLREVQDIPNPLLSTVNTIGYAWKAEGCDYPSAASSLFDLPLNNLAAAGKKVVLTDPNSDMARMEQGYRLMLIIPKDANPQTRAEIEAILPRGEVTLLVATKPEQKAPTVDETIARAWSRPREAIGTAYIKYRMHRVGANKLKPLSPEDIDKLFTDRHWKLSQSEAYDRVFQLFTEETLGQIKDQPPASFEFQCVGVKSIERSPYGDIRFGDGEIDIHYDAANRQITINQQGKSSRGATSLYDFLRPSPSAKLLQETRQRAIDGAVVLEREHGVHVVDPKTGTVYLKRFDDKASQQTSVDFQFAPQTFTGRIVVPRLTVTLLFQEKQLSSLTAFSVEEIRINEPFEATDFQMSFDAGTTVIDHREARASGPRGYRLKEPITDAAVYFHERIP